MSVYGSSALHPQGKQSRGRTRTLLAPGVLAALTGLTGLVNVVSAVTPEARDRLALVHQLVPLSFAHAASAGTVVAGLLLIVLAHGLRRRKRRALQSAVALLALSSALHVLKGLDLEEATGTLLLAGLLLWRHRDFPGAGDPQSRWRAPAALVAILAVSYPLGLGLLYAHTEAISGSPTLWERTVEVFYGLVGATGPVTFTREGAADVVFFILLGLGITTVLLPTYLLLRPMAPRARLTDDDVRRLRQLLARHGARDSLAYFALRHDKAAVFSPSGKAAVSYRVVSGVMLASGDPIGDCEAWPGAISAFIATAADHAWVPAVIGCSERGGDVWVREAGLRALELGDEAVIDVADFTLEGRPMRNVRQTVTRVRRLDYRTRVSRLREVGADERAAIRAQAALWRGAEVERGFSMALGRFGAAHDPDCVVVTATRDGVLQAVLHFVPWGADGLSLDIMRRDRDADTGLNELMIVALIEAAPSLGISRVSLNFAVFRAALERGARLGAGPVLRVWRALLLFVSRWFQIESLYRFNAKFRPTWEPRFICYPSARDLPRVAVAALQAEAFIVGPRQWWELRRLRSRGRELTPARLREDAIELSSVGGV